MPTAMNDAFWKGMVALTNGSVEARRRSSPTWTRTQTDAYTQ